MRRLTARLQSASLRGLHPATSCPHHFSGSESHFELFPSCIPLFQGTLAVGSVQQPWYRLCRQLPARVSPLFLGGTVGGAADMNHISAKKDVFPSEMVTLEGEAVVQVCRNDF